MMLLCRTVSIYCQVLIPGDSSREVWCALEPSCYALWHQLPVSPWDYSDVQMTTMSQANMQSKVEVVSQIHQDLLQALPLIPVYLASGHPPHDAVDATCFKLLFNGRSKGVVEPRGAFAGLPAELWRIIFEKLCPACTSVITGPSVIARDISNAQLVCRKFYYSGVFAWSALKKLIQAEAEDFMEPEAGTNRQATRQLQELEMQRSVYEYADRLALPAV